MSLCGVLRGAGVDETDPRGRGKVNGRKLPVKGNAAGGGVCDPTDVGGRARHGDLFVGVFAKDREFLVVSCGGATDRGTVSNVLGSG